MADKDLQNRLEKLGAQLVTEIEAWEKRTRGERAQVLDHLTLRFEEKVGEALTKLAETGHREQVRLEKRERRRLEREERKQHEPTIAAGIVFLIAAVICAVMGIVNPQTWWMVFVALGLGLGGARQLAGATRQRRELEKTVVDATQVKPSQQAHEVDVLCDALLNDLASAPETVRTFISDPHKTVTSMRATLKSLDLRRQQLLGEDAFARLEAARAKRLELQSRHDTTADAETKLRMAEALGSMESQERALQQLLVMTERVDSEYTSLLVHLQELRTRVSIAKSSSTSVQLEGVKASVLHLNDELGAISEAMDAVRRDEATAKGRTRVAD
jgi:hypothetical protein